MLKGYPGAFSFRELSRAPESFLDWWFEASCEDILKEKKEFFDRLNIKSSDEAFRNAADDYNLLARLSAKPDRNDVFLHNFTRRYKWE